MKNADLFHGPFVVAHTLVVPLGARHYNSFVDREQAVEIAAECSAHGVTRADPFTEKDRGAAFEFPWSVFVLPTTDHYGMDSTPGRIGTWLQSSTGDKVWTLDPRPDDVRLLDMARGLANECRYGRMMAHRGQWYSVAEHSLLVADFVALAHPDHPEWEQEALLHDGEEAYGFGDVPRPLKHEPGIRMVVDAVQGQWTRAIYTRFGVTSAKESRAAIKRIDHLLVFDEKEKCLRWPEDGRDRSIPAADRLRATIRCLQPADAEVAFLRRVALLFPSLRDEAGRLLLADVCTGGAQ